MQRVCSGSQAARAGLDGGGVCVGGGRAAPAGGIRFCLTWREASSRKPTQRASAVLRHSGQRRASLDIMIVPLLMHGGPGR